MANLYCKSSQETMVKEIHTNLSCSNSVLNQFFQPFEFGVILQNKLEKLEECYSGGTAGIVNFNQFSECLEANNHNLLLDTVTDDCDTQSCVAIECYSETEYKNKINQDAPQMEDHSLKIEDGLLIYYSKSKGHSYVCRKEEFDLEDKFDKNETDLICQNLGFDYMESMEFVPCNYEKHYYMPSKKTTIHCGCVCDELFEECSANQPKSRYNFKCSGIEVTDKDCININCKSDIINTTWLIIIIVCSSLLFIIICLCICCKLGKTKDKTQNQNNIVKPQQSKSVQPQPVVQNYKNNHPQPTYGVNNQNNSQSGISLEQEQNNNFTDAQFQLNQQQQYQQNPMFNNQFQINPMMQPANQQQQQFGVQYDFGNVQQYPANPMMQQPFDNNQQQFNNNQQFNQY